MRPEFVLLLALFVMLDREGILAAVFLAAAIHETAHFTALRAFGAPVRSFELTLFGGEIRLEPWENLSYGREVLAVAAGPASNVLCAALASFYGAYFFAGINMVLAVFNLLPMRTLDGGRILFLALSYMFDPMFAESTVKICTIACGVLLICAVCGVMSVLGFSAAPVILLAWLAISVAGEVGIVKKGRTV